MKLSPILILLAACGGRERGGGDDDGPNIQTSAAPLAEAHVAPDRASSDGVAAGNLTVQAAIGASVLAGGARLVTTGTLISNQSGQRWSAEPNDRLVVEIESGRYELVITALQGDFSSSDAFFAGNHLLEATVRTDGAELTVRSQRSGTTRSASIRGSTTIEGASYQLDLASDGTEYFESDSTGTEYRDQHRLSGTVDFDGAHLDVDEGWDFNLVSTTGSGRATVTSAVRTIASHLEAGDHRYDWREARMQKAFRDGRPNEVDTFWGATGDVLRDGEAYGQYHLASDLVTSNAGVLKFQLLLPGQTIDVESWQVH